MPDVVDNEDDGTPKRAVNERTEAKFFEDVDKLIAEIVRLGADYVPPDAAASLAHLQAKRQESLSLRTVHQRDAADEEIARNVRADLFKPLGKQVTSLVDYAISAGKSRAEIADLRTISRRLTGSRAGRVTEKSISVSRMSFVSRADNFAQFVELYDAFNIATTEEQYKSSTQRARLQEIRNANSAVVNAEAKTNGSCIAYDSATYLDDDSLLKACIAAKAYIRAKYKYDQPYKNIAKTRFVLPTRLRK